MSSSRGQATGLLTQHAEASYINTSGPSPTESSADGYQDTSLVILAESIAFTGSVSGSWIRGGAAGERLDGYGSRRSVSFTPDESAWYDLDVTSSGTGSGGTGSILVYLYDLYDPCVRVL